jgi:2-keto-4-pentenoate hydratase
MALQGVSMHVGDVIMTGALGPMVDLGPGSAASASIDGLGTVRTRNEDRE